MKIALIRAHYNPYGGAERFLNSAVDAMIMHGHSPTIVTRSWPNRTGNSIAHEIVNPWYLTTAGRDRNFASEVRKQLCMNEYDLVQSYERLDFCDVFHAVDGVHAEWLDQRLRVQSRWQRIGRLLNPHHRYLLDVEKRMYESPNLRAVICISEMVKQDILRHYQVAPEKLFVVYGSIDTDAFHPRLTEIHRKTIRQKYNIPANASVAIHVGSGFERKGVAVLLHATALTSGLYTFVIGTDKRLTNYRSLAKSLGIEQRVIFTNGIGDVKPYYAASDVFIMPTIYEPFGLVFGEAMACGLPVIASTKSGATDWIKHGENGYVVDALDAATISDLLQVAIATPQIGIRGRATILARNNLADIGTQYNMIYKDLLLASR
jgi:UDP-glucose:(heptosyl)LPS alpha-1,3-glucosyltransferase